MWQLYRAVIARIGPRPTLIEWDSDMPPLMESYGDDENDKALRGSLQFWPIQVRPLRFDGPPVAALLLGPLAVEPAYTGRGIGMGLMRVGLQRAKQLGHAIVILVGDLPYFGRFGFRPAPDARLSGPVDQQRVLWRGEGEPTGIVSAA